METRRTGLEPATTGSTVQDSNQLSYRPNWEVRKCSSPAREVKDAGQRLKQSCFSPGLSFLTGCHLADGPDEGSRGSLLLITDSDLCSQSCRE